MGAWPAVGASLWEILAVAFVVLVPTLPATYFLWSTVGGGRGGRGREIESGRSSATPFAVITRVGTAILVVAVALVLLAVAVRAAVA
ncbi:MAG TPA: hypothetical protein VNJ46_09870 [Gaiellaceae bacterium]|nr:hypothetical protein [Gaiellaceae bacterium]